MTGTEKQYSCLSSLQLHSRRVSKLIGCRSSKWYRSPVPPFSCLLQTPPITLRKNNSVIFLRGPQPSEAFITCHHYIYSPLTRSWLFGFAGIPCWRCYWEQWTKNQCYGDMVCKEVGWPFPTRGGSPGVHPALSSVMEILTITGWVPTLWCKCEVCLLFGRLFLLSMWTYFRLVLTYRTHAKTAWI